MEVRQRWALQSQDPGHRNTGWGQGPLPQARIGGALLQGLHAPPTTVPSFSPLSTSQRKPKPGFSASLCLSKVFQSPMSCLFFKTQNLNPCMDQLRPWEFIRAGEIKFKHLETHAEFFTQFPMKIKFPDSRKTNHRGASSPPLSAASYSVEVNQTDNLTF